MGSATTASGDAGPGSPEQDERPRRCRMASPPPPLIGRAVVTVSSKDIGVTRKDLVSELRSGKSIAQVAGEHGVSATTVETDLVHTADSEVSKLAGEGNSRVPRPRRSRLPCRGSRPRSSTRPSDVTVLSVDGAASPRRSGSPHLHHRCGQGFGQPRRGDHCQRRVAMNSPAAPQIAMTPRSCQAHGSAPRGQVERRQHSRDEVADREVPRDVGQGRAGLDREPEARERQQEEEDDADHRAGGVRVRDRVLTPTPNPVKLTIPTTMVRMKASAWVGR